MILCWAWAALVLAQGNPDLTLPAALLEALKNNPALMAESAAAEAAAARVSSAGSLEDPQLGLRAMNYPVSNFSSKKFEMTGNEISLSQKFPYPGKRALLERAAALRSDSQAQSSKLASFELKRAVKEAFFTLYLAQELVGTQRQKLSLLEHARSLAIKKLPLSQVSQEEVTALEVEAAKADAELGIRLSKFARGQALLNHLMGRASHKSDEKLSVSTRAARATDKLGSLALIETALANNPKILALKKAEEAQKAQLEYTALNTLPDFEAMLGYTQRDATQPGNGDDFASAGISVNLPIWASSKQSAERTEAKALLFGATKLREEEENHVRHYISDLVSEIASISHSLETYRKSILPLLDQSADLASRAYASGQEKFASLLEKINARFQSQEEYLQILVDLELKQAELDYIVGAEIDG